MFFIIGRIFIAPIKWILKLAFNSVLGGVLIWVINIIGGGWGFHIGLNIYTSVLVRYFGYTWCGCFDIIEINCLKMKTRPLEENGFGMDKFRKYHN